MVRELASESKRLVLEIFKQTEFQFSGSLILRKKSFKYATKNNKPIAGGVGRRLKPPNQNCCGWPGGNQTKRE